VEERPSKGRREEEELDFPAVDGTSDTAETRLVADLTDCHEGCVATKDALVHPATEHSGRSPNNKKLVKAADIAADIAKAGEETVRARLRAHRRAKL
jgi:ATP-dependent phosphoenolpyruvate carboxykinase